MPPRRGCVPRPWERESVAAGWVRVEGNGVGGYKDFAPNEAVANRNAVAAFSPALADIVGLRWVTNTNGNNSEGVVVGRHGKPRNTRNTRTKFRF